ncbi:MAG: glycoside hydrolase family 43 protein [Faecalibacterium sp.]|nr:glycoside hydrolase family 43 protein [Faecalibacterium sp.]
MKKAFKILAVLISVIMAVLSFASSFVDSAEKVETVMKPLEGDAYNFDDSNGVVLHDPTLFKAEDGTYYLYGSHIVSAKSDDLINWKMRSSGVYDSNRTLVSEGSTVRETLSVPLAWTDAAQVRLGSSEDEWQTNVWASDVFYNRAMGKYCYYACCSLWGKNQSVIWFATSDSPEGTFEYQDCVVYSGFNNQTTLGKINYPTHYSFTNIPSLIENGTFSKLKFETQSFFSTTGKYSSDYGKAPNCIDPGLFYDENGNLWMTYGSWSGGIYIMPLVEKTGLPDYAKMKNGKGYNMYFGKLIASTNAANEGSGEGPYIVYDSESGYYYLFQTYSSLEALGGYNIREYRSKNPDGPYVDITGTAATEQKNTGVKISGNYKFSSNATAYLSGGHSSCMIDSDGKIYQAYHTRYNDGVGAYHTSVIHQMLRTESGWLTMLPFAYSGETVSESGYDTEEIAGDYELVDFSNITFKSDSWNWADVDKIISPTQNVTFTSDGKIMGLVKYSSSMFNVNEGSVPVSGTWSKKDGSYQISLMIGDITYEGVLCKMKDDNGKEVMALSAIGSDNSTVWAAQVQ